jgi:hypothetical protein
MSEEMKKSGMPRRHALKVLGSIPAALTVSSTAAAPAGQPHLHVGQVPAAGKSPFVPKFFTEDEWKTANLLADMIIPRDEGSGSASESGAVEYIDEYAVFRGESVQTELRGGLMWLERECSMRFDKKFVDCSEDQRKQVLDLIAFPEKRTPGYSQAIAFFNRFRDLTAGGFYTSKIGIADLGYQGNRAFDWQGCPDEALKKLDLKKD